MNPSELDALVARANAAGFSTVPEYAVSLEEALRLLGSRPFVPWLAMSIANAALKGRDAA